MALRHPGRTARESRAEAQPVGLGAERDGIGAGRRELIALAGERKLSRYPFYWAARADLERRAGCHTAARENYSRAIALARSPAERVSFERRIESMGIS